MNLNLQSVIPKICLVFYSFFCWSDAIVLRAYISQHGLHGEIEFTQKNATIINIRTNLKPTLQYPDQVWRWAIYEFPVDYRVTNSFRCSTETLGSEIIDLTEELGYLVIPGKDKAEFESLNTLTGLKGVWGRSLVLENAERDKTICASIFSTNESIEKHAVAKFSSPIAGTLHFRWITSKDLDQADSYIESDLYHTKAVNVKTDFTQHGWKLFVTDIFDADKSGHEDNCNVLQMVFDSGHSVDGVSVGDLDNRFGLVKVATDGNIKKFKTMYKDEVINMLRSDVELMRRNLYVVIYDDKHKDSFLGCAKLRLMQLKVSKVLIDMDGIKGTVELTQRSAFDLTWVNFKISSSDKDYESDLRYVSSVLNYTIKELPPMLAESNGKDICNTTGDLYNPENVASKDIPPPGMGTQDQYPVGDLFGKYKDRTEYLNHKYLLPGLANELSGAYWDIFLPLQGIHSVVHRAFVIGRREPKRDICGSILPYEFGTGYQLQLTSAQVIFRYPIVGRIVFRQPKDNHWEDTTIIIESLIHADGSNMNNTFDHRWAIHDHPPGRDWYNWSARCLSAGKIFEPYDIDVDSRHPERYCRHGVEGLCRLGDLTTRHGSLIVAGRKRESAKLTRKLMTDTRLPLSGKHSILKRSLVIYDDHGPVARGERMACSIITGLYRRKAVARDWYGTEIKGRMELIQQSEYDITNGEVKFEGLQDIRSFRIHIAPVEKDLEFPCESGSLYDTYNPYFVDKFSSPPKAKGTSDQYPIGDLSAKYGLLDNLKTYSKVINDTQMTLFGKHSIIGRSLVLHKRVEDKHWSCATIERGYSPSEAREIRAIASFHHPGGFLWGYIRMTQLIHNDGSASDTVLEVNLRYPGETNRNVSYDHKWSIYVNPVGVDAAVKVTHTRCVAAGYRWNPYFTQLADPLNTELYNEECGQDNPLRCDAGDISSRIGTINIGAQRQVFSDGNLPLEGDVTAMGRSIVIFGPRLSTERLACANIQPDKDIVKYVSILRPARFSVNSFLSDIRAVLGVPPWMVFGEVRKNKILHAGACIQLLLHFTGPEANKLELDFSRLLASGHLDAPSIQIPGYVFTKRKKAVSYLQCGSRKESDKKKILHRSSSAMVNFYELRVVVISCILKILI